MSYGRYKGNSSNFCLKENKEKSDHFDIIDYSKDFY